MLEVDGALVLQRHGLDEWSPPHRIDHRAHVAALLGAGVDRVLALSSVGSLRTDWPVGTCVLADDCYAPGETSSYHDDPRSHAVPGFDPAWRATVRELLGGQRADAARRRRGLRADPRAALRDAGRGARARPAWRTSWA